MNEVAERFRRWFDYEKGAHADVLEALEAVPEERRGAPEYRKSLGWLEHIAAARGLWLFRMGIAESGPTTFDELFPQATGLETARAALERMHEAWDDYLARVDDAELARVFRYRATEGDLYENAVEDLLVQLHGHSSYHRGQIASAMRAMGAEPAATDYVFWARRPAEEGEGE